MFTSSANSSCASSGFDSQLLGNQTMSLFLITCYPCFYFERISKHWLLIYHEIIESFQNFRPWHVFKIFDHSITDKLEQVGHTRSAGMQQARWEKNGLLQLRCHSHRAGSGTSCWGSWQVASLVDLPAQAPKPCLSDSGPTRMPSGSWTSKYLKLVSYSCSSDLS